MAKKESPYDGAFALIAAELPGATFKTSAPSRAVFSYEKRDFLVVLSRTGGGTELRASIEVLSKGEWTGKEFTNKFAEWKKLAASVGAKIRHQIEQFKKLGAEKELEERHTRQVEAANAIVQQLSPTVKHDDRIHLTVTDSWTRSASGPGVQISVTLREAEWHYAQLIIDFLKENTGDPRPAGGEGAKAT